MPLFLIITCLFLCTSCNLRPVYNFKDSPPELSKLSAIKVEAVNSIEGAEFVYHLSRLLPDVKGAKKKYFLKAEFSNKKFPSIIQKNSNIVQEMITQTVSYKLINIESNKEVTSGRFNHIATYNMNCSAFIGYTAGEVELEELTKQAAEEILTRLILYFKNIESAKFSKMS